METYGFVVMGLGHLRSAGGRQDDIVDRYIGYSGDNPVGSPPWQTMGELRDDILKAGAEYYAAGSLEGIPVETRHPCKSHECLMAKKLSDGEMDLLIGSLNGNGRGLRFYRKETEAQWFANAAPPGSGQPEKRHRRDVRFS